MDNIIYSTQINRVKYFTELGLVFLIAEGLFRRMEPSLNSVIMALKFVYFPILFIYAFFWARINIYRCLTPVAFAFVAWIIGISAVNALYHPFTSIMGMLIFVIFIPLSAIGEIIYGSTPNFISLCRTISFVCICIGLLCIVQWFLPPNHWLNLQLDFKTASFSTDSGYHRLNGTFQYPTVFSNFCIGAMICSIITMVYDRSNIRIIGFLSVISVVWCVYGSSSRIGLISVAILIFALLYISKLRKHLTVTILSIIVFCFLFLCIDSSGTIRNNIISGRALNTNGLIARVESSYLGGTIENSSMYSGFTGIGLGPNTHGVKTALAGMGLYDYKGPDILWVEGGYANLLLIGGIFAIVFYFAFVSIFFFIHGRDELTSFVCISVGIWALAGNLPLLIHSVPVLASLWWILAGASRGFSNRN